MEYPHYINPSTGLNNLGHAPIWLDAEFTGLHRNTQLISIGLSTISGASFYAEFLDYDMNQVDDETANWLKANVLSGLLSPDATEFGVKTVKNLANICRFNGSNLAQSVYCIGDHDFIRKQLKTWMTTELNNYTSNANTKFQFYCDCYAYDWMLFNDLFAQDSIATKLPEYIYYIPFDLCTEMQVNGIDPDISREEFIGEVALHHILHHPLLELGTNRGSKHNSLVDALVAQMCTLKIQMMNH